MTDAKFKLEDILNKKKAPPQVRSGKITRNLDKLVSQDKPNQTPRIHVQVPIQILDLANVKIESEEDFKAVIEKIPDYRIKPERVSEGERLSKD